MGKTSYVAFDKDDFIREKSSSGGVFFRLAEYIFGKNGVVFGACFNESWDVVHKCCNDICDIPAFMGSKYVQSNMGNCYKEAQWYLENQTPVLFVGCPCQIAGLKLFLGKDYDNLYCIDFVCHGVPSPALWKDYLRKKSGDKVIKAINFRDKTHGWDKFSLRISYADGTEYCAIKDDDLYMRGFLQDINLRPSCFKCRFKGEFTSADLTVSDLWGCDTLYPEFYDNKGVSLVTVNTDKGICLWEQVRTSFMYADADYNNCSRINSNMVKSAQKDFGRALYFAFRKKDWVLYVLTIGIVHRFRKKLARLLSKYQKM